MNQNRPHAEDLGAHAERFTSLLLSSQRRIYSFILTLVPDRAAADDLLQEVAVVLWRKFDLFEPGTNFSAWAMQIARFCVFEHHRRCAKAPLHFSDDTLARLADEAEKMSRHSEELRDTLHRCIGRLTDRQRQLLTDRYDHSQTLRQIAERSGRTPQTVYRVLQRIHQKLHECIEHSMSEAAR